MPDASSDASTPVIPYGRQWVDDDDIAAVAEVLSGDYTHGITGQTYAYPGYDEFATFPTTG